MIFTVLKISFVVLLTSFYARFTFCNPDYESVNSTLRLTKLGSNSPSQSVWYIYNFDLTDNPLESQNDASSSKLETTRVTRNPLIQYGLEDHQGNLVGKGQTIRVYTTPDSSFSTKQPSFDIANNTRIETIFNTNAGGIPATTEPKRTSEIKCEEYGRAVGRKVWALALVGTEPEGVPVSSKRGRCEGVHTPLIVGGTKAQPGEFPHMTAIGWLIDGTMRYLCGGSLISEQWVLTAAHCTHGRSGSPSVVKLGTHLLNDNTLGQVFEIKQIIKHPTYKPPALYADIALLELNSPVAFRDSIRPICLYQEYDAAPPQAWATGWGITQIGEDGSDVLLKTNLNILDTVSCARKYNISAAVPRGIVPSMVCAGDSSGDWQSDTCQGDSGGPLQIIHPTINCLYQQVGITSFGKLCALRESPGVYTRVSQYLNWIENIVWPDHA